MFPIFFRSVFTASSASFSCCSSSMRRAASSLTLAIASSAFSLATLSLDTSLLALLNWAFTLSSSQRASRHLASMAITSSTSSTRENRRR